MIEIDTYCCDFNWDGICEGEYQDCINGDYSNNNFDYLIDESDREMVEFNQDIFDEVNSREVVGYYVFRDSQFIDFVAENFYYDFGVSSGLEYCYSISAVYDNAQSELSNESCIESFGDFLLGDVNFDNSLDVTDIIIVLNMILGTEDPNYSVADMNDDGYITANELGMFLVEKVTIDSKSQQTPQYGRMTSEEGEFIFINNC